MENYNVTDIFNVSSEDVRKRETTKKVVDLINRNEACRTYFRLKTERAS